MFSPRENWDVAEKTDHLHKSPAVSQAPVPDFAPAQPPHRPEHSWSKDRRWLAAAVQSIRTRAPLCVPGARTDESSLETYQVSCSLFLPFFFLVYN